MRFSNPALQTSTFANFRANIHDAAQTEKVRMTVQGTVNKTGLLLILTAAAFAFVWNLALTAGPAAAYPFFIGGFIAAFVVALFAGFKKEWAMFTGPLYAVLEGLGLGGLSFYINMRFPGIPFWAVVATFAVMFSMLALFKTGVIKVTEKFKAMVGVGMMAVMVIYLVQIGLSFFLGMSIPGLFSAGWIGLGFSLLVVGLAAFRLVLDFDFITKGADQGLPKYMEWYSAFGLIVGLAWLYVEILRLLTIIASMTRD